VVAYITDSLAIRQILNLDLNTLSIDSTPYPFQSRQPERLPARLQAKA
jgi:hypothetical protein